VLCSDFSKLRTELFAVFVLGGVLAWSGSVDLGLGSFLWKDELVESQDLCFCQLTVCSCASVKAFLAFSTAALNVSSSGFSGLVTAGFEADSVPLEFWVSGAMVDMEAAEGVARSAIVLKHFPTAGCWVYKGGISNVMCLVLFIVV
jgi:hypothetical protein